MDKKHRSNLTMPFGDKIVILKVKSIGQLFLQHARPFMYISNQWSLR